MQWLGALARSVSHMHWYKGELILLFTHVCVTEDRCEIGTYVASVCYPEKSEHSCRIGKSQIRCLTGVDFETDVFFKPSFLHRPGMFLEQSLQRSFRSGYLSGASLCRPIKTTTSQTRNRIAVP